MGGHSKVKGKQLVELNTQGRYVKRRHRNNNRDLSNGNSHLECVASITFMIMWANDQHTVSGLTELSLLLFQMASRRLCNQ